MCRWDTLIRQIPLAINIHPAVSLIYDSKVAPMSMIEVK